MMCYEHERILLRIIKNSCGGFLTSAHFTTKNDTGKKQLVPEFKSYYQLIRWFSSVKIKNNSLDKL